MEKYILADENEDGKSEAGTEICSDFQRSCSCCPSEVTGGSCCAAKLVDKLTAQLKANEKCEKELTERAEKAESELEVLKRNEWELTRDADLFKECAEEAAQNLYNTLWKTFPLSSYCYTISTMAAKSKHYLYVSADGKLHVASRPYPCTSNFEIRKNSDGTFAIFSPFLKKFFAIKKVESNNKTEWEFGFFGEYKDSAECKLELVFSKEADIGQLAANIHIVAEDKFIHCEKGHELKLTNFPNTEFLFALAE